MRRFALILAAVLAVIATANAQQRHRASQPPAPRSGEQIQPPQEKAAGKDQSGKPDSRGTVDAPFIVEMHNPPKTEQQAAENAEETERKASADRWTIGLTGVLAFATIMQFFALGYQGYWIRRTVKSAERSLALIERALVVGERVETSPIVRWPPPGAPGEPDVIAYRVTIFFRNTGRTPAKAFISNANFVAFGGAKIPSDFRYPDRVAVSGTDYGVVGPQVQIPVPIDISITDLVSISFNTKIGIIYGWAEYSDIFGSRRRNRTEFCTKIEIVGDMFSLRHTSAGPSPSPLGFAVHGPYNATDGDCFHKPGEVPVAAPGELPEVTQPPPESA